jgi:uncharacterized membrane-anchored protein YitT (DUF2179 family)
LGTDQNVNLTFLEFFQKPYVFPFSYQYITVNSLNSIIWVQFFYKLFNFLRVADIKLVLDVTIILISAFVFDTNIAMYAVITSVVTARVISAILTGYNGRTVKFEIVPSSEEKGEKIIRYVIDIMNRDVTSYISRGEYTKTERRMLSVICTPHEALDLKRFVADVDPDAFSAMSSGLTVWGRHFSNIKDVYNN